MSEVLVFQHIATDYPGFLFELLQARGIGMRVVQLEQQEPIPPLAGFRALWVMGGPMDVWQEDEHPWLRAEKVAIRAAVLEHRIPYLGICLGHQLLAAALGGEVGPATRHEVGVADVTLNQAGRAHPLLAGLPATSPVFQWHFAEVKRLPPGAELLAHSADCPVQAIAVGSHALGLQGHIEISAATVAEWLAAPAARAAVERTLGPAGPAAVQAEVERRISELNDQTRRLFERLIPPA